MTGRRVTVKLKMRRMGWLDRIWYRSIRQTPPLSVGGGIPSEKLARLVPTRFRRFHRAYATLCGFFWLPCPLCGREFGGHQFGKSVPDPMNPPFGGVGVCPPCSRALPGRSHRASP